MRSISGARAAALGAARFPARRSRAAHLFTIRLAIDNRRASDPYGKKEHVKATFAINPRSHE